MQLPIDVKAVLDAALGTGEDAHEPVAVSVVVDATAPADLVAHVRSAFASAAPHVRVTLAYLDAGARVAPADDVAVVVAGVDRSVGRVAAEARALGVPTMVATTLPALVDAIACEEGCPIPVGDIVAPEVSDAERRLAGDAPRTSEAERIAEAIADAVSRRFGRSARSSAVPRDAATLAAAFDAEPYALTDEAARSLDERMGQWMIATRRDKRIAMALAFPFVRRPLALETVYATAAQNAAIGVVPFIPGADMPIMTLNQAKMVLKIAAAYGEEMDAGRVKEIVAVIMSGIALRSVARTVAGVVPVLGWAVRGVVGYAGTVALGRTAVEYFEGGGGLVGLAEAATRAYEAAAKAAVEVGGAVQDVAAARAAEAASAVRSAASR